MNSRCACPGDGKSTNVRKATGIGVGSDDPTELLLPDRSVLNDKDEEECGYADVMSTDLRGVPW